MQLKKSNSLKTIEIEFENDFYRKLELFCEANSKKVDEYVKEAFLCKYMVDMYGDLNEKGKPQEEVKEDKIENEKKECKSLKQKKSSTRKKKDSVQKENIVTKTEETCGETVQINGIVENENENGQTQVKTVRVIKVKR